MPKHYFRGALIACSLLIPLLPADADVRIVLKDGRVIEVPVDPAEIQSIQMEPGHVATAGLPPTPVMTDAPPTPTLKPGSPGSPDAQPAAPPPKSGATFIAPVPAPPKVAATAPPASAVSAPPPAGPQPAATPGRIQVGPTRDVKLPSQAAAMAKSGDTIEIDAGTYRGDVASWRADGITIRGVGGRAHMAADGSSAEGKAIWVIRGRDVTVENVEFSGAVVPDGNGAGIRAEGTNLKVINCFFHDSQEGILTSVDTPDSIVDIENSEFARDGGSGGTAHEIYIGAIRELIVRGSYFHEGRVGHLIKTRAKMSVIEGNRISDENGTSSYKIDVSIGGRTYIIGNLIEQGKADENHTLVAYAMEGPTNEHQDLYVVNNTFVNDLGVGNFIASRSSVPAKVINNIFVGGGNVFHGTAELTNNLLAAGAEGAPKIERSLFNSTGDIKETGTKTAGDPGLMDIAKLDYRLTSKSPAIGAGIDPGSAEGMALLPTLEYVHPAHAKAVKVKAPIDIGAYQHGE